MALLFVCRARTRKRLRRNVSARKSEIDAVETSRTATGATENGNARRTKSATVTESVNASSATETGAIGQSVTTDDATMKEHAPDPSRKTSTYAI